MTLTARSLLAFGAAMLAQVPLHAEPVVISDLVEAKAIVESVDMKTRVVLLRGDGGELDTIIAGPDVRNLGQVHPGDHVLVSLHRSVALEISKPGTAPVAGVATAVARAPVGAEPRGVRTEIVHARVQIKGIDLANRTVSFIGPARILRTLQIRDERVLDFVRTLHEGDDVDVTYQTAIAASVVPAR
jgi:hypothetical protein